LKRRERDVGVPVMPKHELHRVITEAAQAIVEQYGAAGAFVIHARRGDWHAITKVLPFARARNKAAIDKTPLTTT